MDKVDKLINEATERLKHKGIICITMPDWADDQRAIVNCLARSAVFSVNKNSEGIFFVGARIPAPSNYDITATGPQLTQAHLDVYLQIIHLFRRIKAGESVFVTPRKILDGIGKADGTDNRKWLIDTIKKISQLSLDITVRKAIRTISFSGSLLTVLSSFEEKNLCDNIELRLSEEAVKLYLDDDVTILFPPRRNRLKGDGSNIAKSMQLQILSHKKPHPMYLSTLCSFCGITISSPSGRRRSMRQAIKLLIKNGDLSDGYIKDDKIFLFRPQRGDEKPTIH